MPEIQQEIPSEQLKPGQYIGNYRVVGRIAEGGMGVVFEALHEEIGRRVAIKVLRREISSNPDIARRFINEARVVTQIQHSGLVQVFDYGRLPDGSAYIVMEFLQGRPLTDRIRNAAGGMAISDALRFGRQLAGALAVTHEAGIVHRDLKPDNVMLKTDREVVGGERTKILDFGIAKVSNTGGGKTRTHAILGSAPYMAPEQCRGTKEISDRTDVYALGVMLFEMVTGRVPFVADEDVEVMTMHIKETPPEVTAVRKDAPAELSNLVARMLTKVPTQRPTMREVVESLDVLLPVPGSGTIPIVPVAEMARRHKLRWVLAAGLGVTGVVLAIGVVLALRSPSGGPTVPHQAANNSPAPEVAPAVKEVNWTIESVPTGALLVRDADSAVLGQTPWTHTQQQGSGTMTLTLRKEGYFKRSLSINLMENAHIKETLKPINSDTLDLPAFPSKPMGRGPGKQH